MDSAPPPAPLDADMHCPLAGILAKHMRDRRSDLTRQWLERIQPRVSSDPNNVFPGRELLDHVPLLMDGIADYLEHPAADPGADIPVVGKAMELGALRHAQGFDVYEILKEYEILGGILFTFLAGVADHLDAPCEKGELLVCAHRVFRSLAVIQESTTAHYLHLADARVADREDRLRAFNRAVSHEIKNQIGAILGASQAMHDVTQLPAAQRAKFAEIIATNARMMRATVENITALSRMDGGGHQPQRRIRLADATAEAVRQLGDRAAERGVTVSISSELPDVDVPAAAVELALNNLVSNAIKYSDPSKPNRAVAIAARVQTDAATRHRYLVVEVSDNGVGVPADKRAKLFQRFFRAHEGVSGAEGTGLGLSIVRESIELLGGTAWAEFSETGSLFAFSLPLGTTSRPVEESKK